jgi:uncharacterized membrane protein (DUF4010 family)
MDWTDDPNVHRGLQLLIAALIGLFVGLERERSRTDDDRKPDQRPFAGIRTFTLVSVSGFAAALLGELLHPAVFVAGLAIVGLLAIASHVASREHGGLTTEVAFVLTYLTGALVQRDLFLLSGVLALLLTAVLATKPALHRFARAVSREDLHAALKFGVISLVILPILPNRTWDPWEALNPRVIWLMVVLISGVSFAGYVMVKIVGPKAGLGLTGLLGGLVSSTATTLSFSQRSRSAATLVRGFAMGILLACTVMYPRVCLEAFVVNPRLGRALLLPLGAITAVALALTLVLVLLSRREKQPTERKVESIYRNPVELRPAIRLALAFAAISFLIKVTQGWFGSSGLFGIALLSGLTDMDALTLSIARLEGQEGVARSTAVAAVLLGSLANTIVKAGIVWTAGTPALRRAAGLPLIAVALATLAVFAAVLALGGR